MIRSKSALTTLAYAVARVKHYNPKQTCIIVTDPRSGGTWLAELMAKLGNAMIIHEPLNANINQIKEAGFNWRQYIPPETSWPEANAVIKKVLSGQILNVWTCRPQDALKNLQRKALLVKFVRAKSLLPWISDNFSFRHTPVLLLRNPIAVAASQIRHGGWSHVDHSYVLQSGRHTSVYSSHAEYIRTLNNIEEILVAGWCVTTRLALDHPYKNAPLVILYEDLLSDLETELNKICRAWHIKFDPRILAESTHPSRSTAKDLTRRIDPNLQSEKYNDFFSQNRRQKLSEIMKHFDINYEEIKEQFSHIKSPQ